MKAERWERVAKLYRAALEREAGERGAFLAEACAGDDDLRREVESLLAQQGKTEGFLEQPALELAARELAANPPTAALAVGTMLPAAAQTRSGHAMVRSSTTTLRPRSRRPHPDRPDRPAVTAIAARKSADPRRPPLCHRSSESPLGRQRMSGQSAAIGQTPAHY